MDILPCAPGGPKTDEKEQKLFVLMYKFDDEQIEIAKIFRSLDEIEKYVRSKYDNIVSFEFAQKKIYKFTRAKFIKIFYCQVEFINVNGIRDKPTYEMIIEEHSI